MDIIRALTRNGEDNEVYMFHKGDLKGKKPRKGIYVRVSVGLVLGADAYSAREATGDRQTG